MKNQWLVIYLSEGGLEDQILYKSYEEAYNAAYAFNYTNDDEREEDYDAIIFKITFSNAGFGIEYIDCP